MLTSMSTVEEIEAAIAPVRLLSGGDQDQHAGLIHEQTAIAGLVPFRTHLPKPTQERTNLPQVLQALHILLTDLALRSLSHDGHDTATLNRAQLCQDCSSCRFA